MTRVSKVLAPLALIAGTTAFVLTEDAGAQPPFGKGQPPFGKGFPGKGDDKKVEGKKGEGKKGEEKKGPGGPGPKSDPVVDAWVAVLITKITDPHDTVRDSARGALVNVGPPALPALQVLADGNDSAKAIAARKLINAIQGGRGPGGLEQPGQPVPGQPGRPGFGAGGMGFPGPGGPMGPGGFGPGGDRGPDRGRGEGRDRGPRREAGAIEVAPMPRAAR